MGWLIALAVIVLVACLPVGIDARYNADGAIANLIMGPIRLRIYPRIKSKRSSKQANKKSTSRNNATGTGGKAKGGSYRDFMPLVRIVLDFLEAFRRKLRVNRLELEVILAGGDPCDLAVNYGKAWAALGNLMPHLERFLIIKKRNLAVECDFAAEKTLIVARVDLTITVARILHIGILHGVRALYHYYKIMNERKGGAKV